MSISNTQFSNSNAIPPLQYYRGISPHMPPRRFIPQAPPASTSLLKSLHNLMTNPEGVTVFSYVFLTLEIRKIHIIVSLLTADSDCFMGVIKNMYGSKRIQNILGISDVVDTFFYVAIMRCFPHIMTDKYASYVFVRAIAVFDEEKKKTMYEHMIRYVVHIARDKYGCIALNKVINTSDNPRHLYQLVNSIARNALALSKDASGNFVVQEVIKQNYLFWTNKIALNLRGHCVDLSFEKYGSYTVEKLLQTEELIVVVVVEELLECDRYKLMRLARNEFGNYVVFKALEVTRMFRVDMFWGLAEKLMPFIHLLFWSHGSNVARILLESIN